MTIKQALNNIAEKQEVVDLMKEIDKEVLIQQSAVYHRTENFTRLKSLVKKMENLFKNEIDAIAIKNTDKISNAIHDFIKDSLWDESIEEDFEIA